MKRTFILLLIASACFAAKGQVTYLDSSFNATGILSINHKGGEDALSKVLIRPNGKSLAIGSSFFDTRTPAATLVALTVAQFDINGKPDPDFGQEGVVVLDQLNANANASDAVLQSDGKLLISGNFLNANSDSGYFVVRLNVDGSFDTSFGELGVAGHPGVFLEYCGALAVQPDGKIVLGGRNYTQLVLIRFHPNGSVDSSFGDNGVVLSDHSIGGGVVSIGLDGLIYVGGVNSDLKPLLERFLPDGILDTSFGTGGLVLFPDDGGISQILIQPDGKIIVSGGFIYRLTTEGTFDPNFDDFWISNGTGLVGIALRPDGIIVGGVVTDFLELKLFRYWPNGQFDPSYGDAVQLNTLVYGGLSLQPDGKIILIGGHSDDLGFLDFCLLRLTESVEIDTLYGLNGLAVQNIGTNHSGANSVIIDDQNRILVGGDATYVNRLNDPPFVYSVGFVSRFQPNGTLDTSFSENGFRGLPNSYFIMNLFTRQPDGKIISAGGTNGNGGGLGVYRMLPDGNFDLAFGLPFGNGSAYYDLSVFNIFRVYPTAVAISPDSAIVVMSEVVDIDSQHKIAIVQFGPSGLPDLSFGVDGAAVTTGILIPGDFDLNAGLIQPDGKILVGGTFGTPPNIFLVRFMPDGSLDNTFGTSGRVLKPFTGVAYYLNALAIQADGHILLTGSQSAANSSNLIVGRLNPDGTRDNTFSGDGLVVVNTGTVESGHALAAQADGKMVVAGMSASSSAAETNDPLFVRLLTDGTLDSSFAGTGYVVTNLPGDNRLDAMAVQPNGSYITAGYSNNDYLLIRYLSKLNVGLLEASNLQSEVLVYPNPVQGHASFTYSLSAPSRVSLELFDMQGKLCHRFLLDESRPQGEQTASIYFPLSLIPGVYILRVQAEGGSKSVRVVIAG